MTNVRISDLRPADEPLTGIELMEITQDGISKKTTTSAIASTSTGNTDFLPALDLTYDIGSTTLRWKEVFAANGVFVGSLNPTDVVLPVTPDLGGTIIGYQIGAGTVRHELAARGNVLNACGLYTQGNPAGTAIARCEGFGSSILGSIITFGAGSSYITSSGAGSLAGGLSLGYANTIESTGNGTLAFGYTYGGTGTVTPSILRARFAGSVAFGNATSRGTGSSRIDAENYGSFVGGHAYTTGTGNVSIRSTVYGAMAWGHTKTDDTGDASILSSAEGSFAQGYAFSTNDGGTASITASGKGASAQGFSYTYGTGSTSTIEATEKGGFAHGFTITYGASLAVISATNRGGFAQGTTYGYNDTAQILVPGGGAFGQGNAFNGVITATESGSFAQGAASYGNISSTGRGTFAQGFAYSYYGSGTAAIVASGRGASAQGFSYGGAMTSANMEITASGDGSSASGMTADQGGGDSEIEATNYASLAHGYVNSFSGNVGRITSSGQGSVAFGRAQAAGASAQILSSSYGTFAMGWAYSGADIVANNYGSFAHGNTYPGNYGITSSGYGSFAQGSADTEAIVASADNAAQFGPGTNALADSLKVGTAGIRFKGTTAAPGGPVNGDFWRAGSYVYVQSNDVAERLTSGFSEVIAIDAIRTFGLTDKGKTILLTGTTGRTWTIDSNANVPFPIGTLIAGESVSTMDITLAITADTLINSADGATGTRTIGPDGGFVIEKVQTTVWKFTGDQAT